MVGWWNSWNSRKMIHKIYVEMYGKLIIIFDWLIGCLAGLLLRWLVGWYSDCLGVG